MYISDVRVKTFLLGFVKKNIESVNLKGQLLEGKVVSLSFYANVSYMQLPLSYG